MKNYVAYHSVRKFGDYNAGKALHFYSGKNADFLRTSIGESVWVIVGTPNKGKTTFCLAGKYTPTEICERKQGGHNIFGSGKPFKPPIELTNLPWFLRLVREQGHFSFGFNLIKDQTICETLHGLLEKPNRPRRTGKLTVADYVKAFETIDGKLSKLQWQILLAHYSAADRQMSARQLAAAVGISKFNVANLHYGKLGRLLCSALGKDSVADNVSSLVSMIPPGEHGNKEWLWIMRPEIAKALQQLGFVPSKAETTDTELSAMEGAEKLVLVRHRQREQSLRDAKIAEARKFGSGKLKCQVPKCVFEFETIYGELGRDYAQVYHLKPLADRTKPSQTKLDDLAIVCANCHAMIQLGGKCRPLNGLIP